MRKEDQRKEDRCNHFQTLQSGTDEDEEKQREANREEDQCKKLRNLEVVAKQQQQQEMKLMRKEKEMLKEEFKNQKNKKGETKK